MYLHLKDKYKHSSEKNNYVDDLKCNTAGNIFISQQNDTESFVLNNI